ncbi:MAG: hypothetical protein HZB51_00045 [Chloroflexi bacterium]|nr:hypothetical protein [Chloroflexota bacterium]
MMNLQVQLTQLESAQLVRRLLDDEPAYIFKHALTQDAATHSILKARRMMLHRQVAQTYEKLFPERLDELSALLAHHFEQADEPHHALDYLQRAAEWSRRKNAHHEEANLLARAITLAERQANDALLADLHARRGKALAGLAQWQEAKQELSLALTQLPHEQIERRIRVLLELAQVMAWLWDMAGALQYSRQALTLAEQIGNDDLIATAMSQLAVGEVSDARTRAGIKYFEQAFARAQNSHDPSLNYSMAFAGLTHYWLGEYSKAVELSQLAIEHATATYDNSTRVLGLANLGMSLMGIGAYADAIQTFNKVCDFARKHQIKPLLARALAMYGGMHLDLFDYDSAERIALEACQIGRAANFSPAVVSATIDLMLNYARRGEIHCAERLIPIVADVLPKTYGSHRWIWELRFAQARAELALANQNWDDALIFAESAKTQSDATSRVKYRVAAGITQAQAFTALGRDQAARAALDAAVELARPVGDPAMFLRAAIASLAQNGNDALAAEARTIAHHVCDELPDDRLRHRFAAFVSEWV